MDKGYQEFLIFMRSWLNERDIKISKEIELKDEHSFCFEINTTNFQLFVHDGFALYRHAEPLWCPLENDFQGLNNLLIDLRNE